MYNVLTRLVIGFDDVCSEQQLRLLCSHSFAPLGESGLLVADRKRPATLVPLLCRGSLYALG